METIALKNDVERLRRELQPAQCTALNEEGFTLLFFACMKKCVKLETIRTIAQVAQKAPSSVDAKTADGETPLYASVFNNRVDVVELLLSLGADVQAINGTRKETALHAAARLGYVEMTTLLLKSGANVNALNARRETPLFSAARAGHHDTVYVLLERAEGVNRTLANEDGKDPLYIASERGHKPVVLLLKAERSHLRHAKAEADVEYRQRLAAGPAVMSSEAMMDRAAADTTYAQMVSSHHVEAQQQKSGAGTSRGAKIDVIPIVAPKPKARTHDPFTGATLGPCRTLEEVGYDAPPPIPRELQGRPPVKPARVGGTSLVVGTGTEEGGRAPIRVESVLLGSDVYEYGVIAPTMHGR